MDADAGEIAVAYFGGFFDDACGSSLRIARENPKFLRMVDGLAERRVARMSHEGEDIVGIVEIVSRHDDEVSPNFSFEREYGGSCAVLCSLLDVVDFFAVIGCAERGGKEVFFIFYYKKNLIKTVDYWANIVLYERFSGDLEERLGRGVREWAHARALSRRHDDEVHIDEKNTTHIVWYFRFCKV